MCNLVVFILVRYSSLNATTKYLCSILHDTKALHCCGFSKAFVFLLDLDGVVCQKHLFKDLSLQTVSGICKGFRKS